SHHRPPSEHDPRLRRDHRPGSRQNCPAGDSRGPGSGPPGDLLPTGLGRLREAAGMADDYLTLLGREGTPLEVTGNKPMLLDDPGAAWLVKSGRVLVFATEVHKDQPTGIRTHLCGAKPGQILFGAKVGSVPGDMGLLAVGMPQGQLIKVPLE